MSAQPAAPKRNTMRRGKPRPRVQPSKLHQASLIEAPAPAEPLFLGGEDCVSKFMTMMSNPQEDVGELIKHRLKPELTHLAGNANRSLHQVLGLIYALATVISAAQPDEKREMLEAVGCEQGKKLPLKLLNAIFPPPTRTVARKRMQNRHSMYAKAMKGARRLGIPPEAFVGSVERLTIEGLAVEASRGKMRDAKARQPGSLSTSVDARSKSKHVHEEGCSGGDEEQQTPKVCSALKSGASATWTDANQKDASSRRTAMFPLTMTKHLTSRIKKSPGEYVGTISIVVNDGNARLHLRAFDRIPSQTVDRAVSDEDLLDEMIRAIVR